MSCWRDFERSDVVADEVDEVVAIYSLYQKTSTSVSECCA
jgi:hypothetical protein